MTFAYSTTTITITSALFPVGVRLEHYDSAGETEDGQALGYSYGVNAYFVTMRIRCDATLRTSLRDFYKTKVLGRAREFILTPDTGVDLGAGSGTVITTARIWQADFPENFEAWDLFYVDLVIRHEGS